MSVLLESESIVVLIHQLNVFIGNGQTVGDQQLLVVSVLDELDDVRLQVDARDDGMIVATVFPVLGKAGIVLGQRPIELRGMGRRELRNMLHLRFVVRLGLLLTRMVLR